MPARARYRRGLISDAGVLETRLAKELEATKPREDRADLEKEVEQLRVELDGLRTKRGELENIRRRTEAEEQRLDEEFKAGEENTGKLAVTESTGWSSSRTRSTIVSLHSFPSPPRSCRFASWTICSNVLSVRMSESGWRPRWKSSSKFSRSGTVT